MKIINNQKKLVIGNFDKQSVRPIVNAIKINNRSIQSTIELDTFNVYSRLVMSAFFQSEIKIMLNRYSTLNKINTQYFRFLLKYNYSSTYSLRPLSNV